MRRVVDERTHVATFHWVSLTVPVAGRTAWVCLSDLAPLVVFLVTEGGHFVVPVLAVLVVASR